MHRESERATECEAFYRESMRLLQRSNIPFVVGGAYALRVYTGISRDTKDFDLFVQPDDVDRTLDTFREAGYEAQKTFPHWLAKALCGAHCIDLIYRSGNGLAEVDRSWFDRARTHELLGVEIKLCPPEELVWMKAFIMERERYDGADVAHLLQSCAEQLDWSYLVARFGSDWPVLLSHLILFGYIYPSEKDRVPAAVMSELLDRLKPGSDDAETRLCRGTLLSRQQYLSDVQSGRFRDARLEPRSRMSGQDIAQWTAAIDHGTQ